MESPEATFMRSGRREKMRKTMVIGIAGGSASGKSTFSGKLAEALQDLQVMELHMDAYFKAPEERPLAAAPVGGKIYRDDNHPLTCDLPRLEQDLAAAVNSGQYQVIIVEGLLTLWDENIQDRLDLRLFVDCPPDERIVRRLKRNMTWGLSFDEIADVYLDLVRYRHNEYVEPTKWKADFIVNGSHFSPRALDMLALYIRSMI